MAFLLPGLGVASATGELSRGDGLRTSMFGGGLELKEQQPPLSWDEPINGSVLQQDTSTGQVEWLLTQVLQQLFGGTGRQPAGRGTFVEFGARDGRFESNTLLLEVWFGWHGLLVEAGRDYIAALRRRRSCRLNGRAGACIFGALDEQSNKTLFWHTRDRVLPELYDTHKWRGQAWEPTPRERETTTTTLDALLQAFAVQHVDLMSCDCEGCETAALKGLDLSRTSVSVFLVERPTCELASRLASRGYVALALWFSYDVVFVSRHAARHMPRPPRLDAIPSRATRAIGAEAGRRKADALVQLCPALRDSLWLPDRPWPP